MKKKSLIAISAATGILGVGITGVQAEEPTKVEYNLEVSLEKKYDASNFQIKKYKEGKAGFVNGKYHPFDISAIEPKYEFEKTKMNSGDALKVIFLGTIESIKYGKDFNTTIDEKIGLDLNDIIDVLSPDSTDEKRIAVKKFMDDEMNKYLIGDTPFLIKKAYHKDGSLDDVINKKLNVDKGEYKIINMDASSKEATGYKSDKFGIEYYFIRANSGIEAINHSNKDGIEPFFKVTYTGDFLLKDMKEFNNKIDEFIDHPASNPDFADMWENILR